MKKTLGILFLMTLPILASASMYEEGWIEITPDGLGMIATINLHHSGTDGTNSIVYTAHLSDDVIIFVGRVDHISLGAQNFMCVVEGRRDRRLFHAAVHARTGFSNGGMLRLTRNEEGECTSVIGVNSSEFFEQ